MFIHFWIIEIVFEIIFSVKGFQFVDKALFGHPVVQFKHDVQFVFVLYYNYLFHS